MSISMDDTDVYNAFGELQTSPEAQQDHTEQGSKQYQHVTQDRCSEGPTTPAVAMSMRLSCNRCRIQKLKCTVPPGSDVCERCTRAKVPCLFGRRSYSKNKKQSGNKSRSIPTTSSNTNLPQCTPMLGRLSPLHREPAALEPSSMPPLTSTSSSVTSSTYSTHPSPFPDWSLEPLLTGSTLLDDPFGTYTFGDQQSCSRDSSYGTCPSVAPDMVDYDCSFDQNTDCFKWLQQGPAFEDEDHQSVSSYRTNSIVPLQSINPITPPSTANASSQPHNVCVTNSFPINSPSNSQKSSSESSLQLTSLVSQIQSQLRQLEETPWQSWKGKANLDDYPVGNILELSQKFSNLASGILSTNTASNPLDHSTNQRRSRATSPSDTPADTPTILLVMAGYMCMMQMYSLVLDQFKQHLNHMPAPTMPQDLDTRMDCSSTASADQIRDPTSIPQTVSSTLSTSSASSASTSSLALRLGGLPSANAVLCLYQINTAVRMVRDALRDIERRLGRGGVFARDLAVVMLLSPSSQRDANSLEETATGIKELIREKFHF